MRLTSVFRGRACLWRLRHAGVSAWRDLVLRCAFCLDLLGNETPIGHCVSLNQALRALLERVGQRVGAHIAHAESLISLFEDKIHAARQSLNGAYGDVSADANALTQLG